MRLGGQILGKRKVERADIAVVVKWQWFVAR